MHGQDCAAFVLALAASCVAASVYGFMQGAWPFGAVEAIWLLLITPMSPPTIEHSQRHPAGGRDPSHVNLQESLRWPPTVIRVAGINAAP
jgi:hypothetical protein